MHIEWLDTATECGLQAGIAVMAAKRSDVWKYFEKEDGKKAKCTLCMKSLAFHGGTTNLREHLKSMHSLLYKPPGESSKLFQQPSIESFTKSKCSVNRANNITDTVVEWIAKDLRPVAIIEGCGFKKMMSVLEPGYTIPSRKQISKLLTLKAKAARDELKKVLSTMDSTVSLTTDIWSSSATEAYITVTLHYLNDSWKMCSYVLETSEFSERHTSANIAEKLIEIVSKYSISTDKVTSIIHDNAANMVASLRVLKEQNGWESLRCAAHTLQLCLLKAFSINPVDRLVSAARKLVGHFKHSVIATDDLKQKQAQMDIAEKKLVQDCPTRWNSIYYMLERLVELRWPVTAVLADDRVTKRADRGLDLRSEQWTLAEELVKILHPIEAATTFLSYEENCSLSCVLPVLHGIMSNVSASTPSDCSHDIATKFKQLIADQILSRWTLDSLEASNPLVLAAAIDPRFRQLRFLASDDNISVADVKEELCHRMELIVAADTNASATIDQTPPTAAPITALDLLLGEAIEDVTTSNTTKEEVDNLFNEKAAARSCNPLIWWRDNSTRFPTLSKVAKSLLHIPATSTPSERVFSKAGLTVSKQRSSLKPKNVDTLIFLNMNL